MEYDLDMYMENLDEFIKDENKVVTYRWLSLTLKLPCDAAKRLLSHYASTHKASETLHVTYLVIGQDKTENDIHGTKVCIVPQKRLEQVKESLWSVSCVHVYSVSKSVLPDVAGTLYTADYDCVRQDLEQSTKYGGIVCSGSTQRSQEDVDSSRSKGTYLPSTPQDTRNAPDPRLSKAVKTEKTGSSEKNKGSAKGSLASMFAAQKTVKKEVTQEPNDGEKGNKATSGKAVASAGKKQNGISGFLKNGVDPREVQPKQPVRATRSSPRKAQVKVETPLEDSPEKPVPKKTPPRKTYGRSKAKPATLPNRSRILKIDSDSSDEDAAGRASDDEEEDPIPPSPSPPPAQTVSDEEDPEPAPVAAAKPSRGMKRKTVDHTFEMENGYLVTKKEEVDVTDSEPEDAVPPPPKKQDVTTSPVKAAAGKSSQNAKKQTQSKKSAKASPVKTKQASIMSFFTKK